MSKPAQSASGNQNRASDPEASVWVSANAGSGKTHVLVNRVIRLLLDGAAPDKILCLTFTRAAAAEMAGRLYDTLSAWIPLSDKELIGRLRAISGPGQFGGKLSRARQLFARALETPGGLKVQTIHAFCERLLQWFPVEAGVVPGFEVLSGRDADSLLAAARARVLALAHDDPASAYAGALHTVVSYAGDDSFTGLLKEILAKRRDLAGVFAPGADGKALMDRLAARLGLAPDDNVEEIAREAMAGVERAPYAAALELINGREGKRDAAQAVLIEKLLAARDAGQGFELLKALYLTRALTPKTDDFVLTKKACEQDPATGEFMRRERARTAGLFERERAAIALEATGALLVLARAITAAYEDAKRRTGRFDYDDLINYTLALFSQNASAPWVLYRLDGGLDHILVDEAQDNSEDQWQIIRHMADEFFAGGDERPGLQRTIFAVGDRKQSIFSFQGADPEAFDAMLAYFQDRVRGAQRSFQKVALGVSFRSSMQVLGAVDEVFSSAGAARGLHEPGVDQILHEAWRRGARGLVEIWPLPDLIEAPPGNGWQPLSGQAGPQHPAVAMAGRIAALIKGWIESGEKLKDENRPVTCGDILILLRNRSRMMDPLVRSLKAAGLPVAGADRLVLTRHIAVQDLIALGRFVLLADDDLVLASVLKSPLVWRDDGAPFNDDDLFDLCHRRGTATVWQQLGRAVAAGAPYATALARLKSWRALSGYVPVHAFYARVLTGDGGRRALTQRLGAQAGEPIDAFINLALEYDSAHTATLQNFLDWIEASDDEIKRDMDLAGDEIRIMTVHGAKGLEAPVVFLPDCCSMPDDRNDPALVFSMDQDGGNPLALWRLKKDLQARAIQALVDEGHARRDEEYNRLLYVAMTRARDRLYIAGFETKNKKCKPSSWYGLIKQALVDTGKAREVRDENGAILCWRMAPGDDTTGKAAPAPAGPAVADAPCALPDWALTSPVPETGRLHWLAPSRLGAGSLDPDAAPVPDGRFKDARAQAVDSQSALSPLAGQAGNRFQRGTLIHTLLQNLPDIAPEQRRARAHTWLAAAAGDLSQRVRDDLAEEVLAVMNEPGFAPVFAPGSLAEVSVAALMGPGRGLAGQIDRLAITPGEVLIVDYKTSRPPPADVTGVAPLYLRQLAAYAGALAAIYPERRIRCALLWTCGPRFMEIAPGLLNQALRS